MEQERLDQDILIENDWSGEDRRRYERYAVAFYLRVYVADEERFLGEVIDISLGGMRLLLCNDAILPDRDYRLRMEVSLESGRQESVSIEARSAWSARDDVVGCEYAGFEFRNLSAEATQSIENIIAELSA